MGSTGRTRILAAGAVVVAVGGVIGFTQLSHADEVSNSTKAASESGAGKIVNGQKILTDTCIDSDLSPHTGFQEGNRCVSTEFGEVASAANDASLLITEAPEAVEPNTPFTLKVSTRNLIRDRFLAAGQGGYYVESSVLQDGIVRGHFHTACRMLTSTDEAPDPAPVPAFFVATEDKQGGRTPDTVTIQVPGLPTEGVAQCASWAGDGSHRTPMMERANQTPAIDAVRITVGAADAGDDDEDDAGNNGGGNNNGNNGNNNGGNNNGGNNAGGNNNGGGNDDGDDTDAGDDDSDAGTVTAAPTKTASGNGTKNTTGNSVKTTVSPTPSETAEVTTKSTKSSLTADSNSSDSDSDSSSSDSSSSDSDDSDSSDSSTDVAPTTKAAKPKASKTTEAAADVQYTDDGAPDDEATPAADLADSIANPPATQSTGPFALLGDHPAIFGGGAVLILLALVGFAFARRNPRRGW